MNELHDKITCLLISWEPETYQEQASELINICMDVATDKAEQAMLKLGYTDRNVLEAIESLKVNQGE